MKEVLQALVSIAAQRSRRSSRSQDESQRRQRQRQTRQIPVIIGAGMRPNGARPAIDLPPGYGEKFHSFKHDSALN